MSAPSQQHGGSRRGRKPVLHRFEAGAELKYCSGCKSWISLDGFNKSNRTWDRLMSTCAQCVARGNQARRERDAQNGRLHTKNRVAPGAKYLRCIRLPNGKRKKVALYKVWEGVKLRCYYPRQQNYAYYGGRGIGMCAEWRNDYDAFRKWAIANGFRKGLTLDRYPNKDGDYEPTNCRWVNRSEQMLNTRASPMARTPQMVIRDAAHG